MLADDFVGAWVVFVVHHVEGRKEFGDGDLSQAADLQVLVADQAGDVFVIQQLFVEADSRYILLPKH